MNLFLQYPLEIFESNSILRHLLQEKKLIELQQIVHQIIVNTDLIPSNNTITAWLQSHAFLVSAKQFQIDIRRVQKHFDFPLESLDRINAINFSSAFTPTDLTICIDFFKSCLSQRSNNVTATLSFLNMLARFRQCKLLKDFVDRFIFSVPTYTNIYLYSKAMFLMMNFQLIGPCSKIYQQNIGHLQYHSEIAIASFLKGLSINLCFSTLKTITRKLNKVLFDKSKIVFIRLRNHCSLGETKIAEDILRYRSLNSNSPLPLALELLSQTYLYQGNKPMASFTRSRIISSQNRLLHPEISALDILLQESFEKALESHQRIRALRIPPHDAHFGALISFLIKNPSGVIDPSLDVFNSPNAVVDLADNLYEESRFQNKKLSIHSFSLRSLTKVYLSFHKFERLEKLIKDMPPSFLNEINLLIIEFMATDRKTVNLLDFLKTLTEIMLSKDDHSFPYAFFIKALSSLVVVRATPHDLLPILDYIVDHCRALVPEFFELYLHACWNHNDHEAADHAIQMAEQYKTHFVTCAPFEDLMMTTITIRKQMQGIEDKSVYPIIPHQGIIIELCAVKSLHYLQKNHIIESFLNRK